MLQAQFYSGPSGSSMTQGIALGPGFSVDRARSFNQQHRRNGRFSSTIMKHGISRDTSLFAATRLKKKQVVHRKNRFESMDDLVQEYNREASFVLDLQKELISMQCRMTIIAIEMINARIIQQAVRGWVARHKLKILKVSRFIYDRVYFRRYYKKRMRAACKMALRMLMWLARRMLKIRRRERAAACLIQKMYHKWKIYRNLRFRIIVLGKAATLWKHCELFGTRRAIMHMRRVEVLRVQKIETAQYKVLLEAEHQRLADEAERLRLEEEHRLEMEAKAKSKSRFGGVKKQKSSSGMTSGGDANTLPKGKGNTGHSDVSDTTHTTHSTTTAASSSTDACTGAPLESDQTVVLKAFSTGLFAGASTTQAMHTFVDNRYGSVYGGFYGEYCCIQDNRVHSFAAVRFRFMLRCLRMKRIKSLNGPTAKNFFYMVSHLHNTPQERVLNPVVQFLQTSLRVHAVKRAVRHTQVSNNNSTGSMGKMLLSSFRRTRLSVAATDASDTESSDTPIASPALSPNKPSVKNIFSESRSPSPTKESHPQADASSLETIHQADVDETAEGKLSVQSSRKTLITAFPTYKPERLPVGFVTHSYRPRTFAELVLMIMDMKKAVLKTPSLVDDSVAPPRLPRATTKTSMSAAVGAATRNQGSTVKKKVHAGTQAHDSHGGKASTSTSRSAGVKPPPLVRMDSTKSNGGGAPLVRMDSTKSTGGGAPLTRGDSQRSAGGAPALAKMDSVKAPLSRASSIKSTGGAPMVRLDSTHSAGDAAKTSPKSASGPAKEPKPPQVSNKSFKRAHAESAVMIPIVITAPTPVVAVKPSFVAPQPSRPVPAAPPVAVETIEEAAAEVPIVTAASPEPVPLAHVPSEPVEDKSHPGSASTQHRSHRVLRPAVVHTPYLAPLPYPDGAESANQVLSVCGDLPLHVEEEGPIVPATTPASASTPVDVSFTKEVVLRITDAQSATPSEILAAARLSVREAEEVASSPVRSAAASRESTRTPGLRPNARLPSMSSKMDSFRENMDEIV